ncbi:nucleotide-binding protein [Acinetobacter ursingii]|uniref:nucleotide-binding protein n=1 Tax=Acinetobacter ursingii TaxID=108980 RepID=UPI00124F7BFF|nr:hypothetical protein [Acinetobacter ursingii]
MILLIANSKGGVGKTSLATSILAELAKTKAVIGIDLDSANKAASSLWSSQRTEQDGKFYYLSGDILNEISSAANEYDEVVIDAGGYDNTELRTAMLLADVILVPLRIGANSNIEGFRNTSDLIAEISKTRESKPKVYGVVTAAPHIGSTPELNRAIQEIIDDPIIEPVAVTLGDRTWYSRAFDAYKGLTEYESPVSRDKRYVETAQAEFMKLFEEIYNVK